MSEDPILLKAELLALSQQLLDVSEHRSRVMVSLTERSNEIACLTADLSHAKTESSRHLDEALVATRKLKRADERIQELACAKQQIQTELSQLSDDLDTARWDLASARGTVSEAELRASQSASELAKMRLELDALRRSLEVQSDGWDREREQLGMTISGLALEIQSEHVAARALQRLWVRSGDACDGPLVQATSGPNDSSARAGFDPRTAQAQALQQELEELRGERADLRARLRELEREAAKVLELEKTHQELRVLQVEHQLLKRKLEDAAGHDQEREALREEVLELRGKLRDTEGLRAETERLRAKLYKAPLNSGTFPLGEQVEVAARGEVAPQDLSAELSDFAYQAQAESAVIADSLGFAVAATGTSFASDSLAAVAGDADRLRTQARQLLGLAEVTQLTVEDREGKFAVFRYFEIDDNLMSIALLVPRAPNGQELDRLVGITRHALMLPRIRTERELDAPHRRSGRAQASSGVSSANLAILGGTKR